MKFLLRVPVYTILLSSVAFMGCNPGKPGPEVLKEADDLVQNFASAIQAENWTKAQEFMLLGDAKTYANTFKNARLKFHDSISMGSTLNFKVTYELIREGEASKTVEFELRKNWPSNDNNNTSLVEPKIRKIEIFDYSMKN